MKRAALPIVVFTALLVSGCSTSHRLTGIWKIDHVLERRTIAENAPMGAAKVPGNPALADDVTISFTSRKITWVIEAGGVQYIEYNYTVRSADAHSVAVTETDPVTGTSQDVVYHFDVDDGRDVMWTSVPSVNQAIGIELKIYFRHAH